MPFTLYFLRRYTINNLIVFLNISRCKLQYIDIISAFLYIFQVFFLYSSDQKGRSYKHILTDYRNKVPRSIYICKDSLPHRSDILWIIFFIRFDEIFRFAPNNGFQCFTQIYSFLSFFFKGNFNRGSWKSLKNKSI